MRSRTPPDLTGLRRSQRRRSGEPPPPLMDRLSTLEDGLLHRILSLLPIDSAVRTSVLSSRYRNVWSTNPSLVFPTYTDLTVDLEPEEYIEVIDSCLDLCSSTEHFSTLSFTIDQFVNYGERKEIARRWSNFAAVRLVDSLSFTFKYPADDPEEYHEHDFYWLVPLPESFFCCWSITTLKLDHCTIPLIPVDLGRPIFPYLESVFLRSVAFTEETLSGFISASTKIKNLNVAGSKVFSDPIVISSSTLETLDLYNNVFVLSNPVEILFAPKLRFLGLCCDLQRAKSVHLANLQEASLLSGTLKRFIACTNWRHLILSVSNAKVLAVDDWFAEFTLNRDVNFGSHPPVFRNLTKLDFCGKPSGLDWVKGLVYNLSECPILEELVIRLDSGWSRPNIYNSSSDDSSDDDSEEDEQIQKNNSEDEKTCANILDDLKKNINTILPIKSIKIGNYYEEPAVNTLIEFFLYKASVLKSVVIYYDKDLEVKSDEIIRKLENIKSISPNVEIITIDDEMNSREGKPRHELHWNRIFCDY